MKTGETGEGVTRKKKSLFTPDVQEFLLGLIEELNPEKLFKDAYLSRGEPLPEWIAKKTADMETAGGELPEPERIIEFIGGRLDIIAANKIKL
jgi:hypothetical protein